MTLYQANDQKGDKNRRVRCGGMHLSGPNSAKSAVVILEQDLAGDTVYFHRLYDKIGSRGQVFSDDRIVDILTMEGPFADVVVDAPLNSPPCVDCTRPVCPGVKRCEDMGVAYMMSLAQKTEFGKRRKKRPLNPQTQRLWDILYAHETGLENLEPTYSSNMAPLVIRTRTLQKRLLALPPGQAVHLKETSIPHALKTLFGQFDNWADYRSFDVGLKVREKLFDASRDLDCLIVEVPTSERQHIVGTVENFHAYVAALTAAYVNSGLYWKPMGLAPGMSADIFLPHPG